MTETSPVSTQCATDDPVERRVSTVGQVMPASRDQDRRCGGPADYDPKPFVGPFPLLSGYDEQLIGDLAARGLCLLAACPGGRERLIDPRDADWHHLHSRRIGGLRFSVKAAGGGRISWPCRPGIAGMA
jgi:hypothetical protein